MLPEDVAARQKLLEESVYETAMERLKHEAETLEQLSNVSPRGLKRQDLQRWMWDWHGKLQKKLKVDVAAIIEEENTWSSTNPFFLYCSEPTDARLVLRKQARA